MRGLRALCCCKDVQDDDQDTPPNRPAQRVEKTSQNAPGNFKNETSSTDMTQDKPPSRDLWKEAYEKLDSDRKEHVFTENVSPTDAIDSVIEETKAKYEQWKKGGLRIHRKGGDDINLRDSAEKIIGAAMKAKDVISTIVSFDPTGHASSAWTVISFGMSIVQNRLDRRDAIFAASAYLAETLAYCALIDTNYRNQNVGSDQNLDEALLRIYTAILEYAFEVKKAGKENAASRISHSISQITDQPLEQLKKTINEQRAAVKDWIDLAANLGDRKNAEIELAKIDEAIGVIKSIELRALSAEEERQLEWMSAAAYSGRQRELQKRRTDKTGNWLLDSDKYNEWKSAPGSLLWLYGISGCGKSVLCSTVVHDVEETCQSDLSISLAYWYFQFDVDETKSVDNMTRSLIRQLSRSPLAPTVTKVWESHSRRGCQPDSRTISNLLRDVLSSVPGEVFLVFDALDECPENAELKERRSLLRILVDLLEGYKDKIHILVTSRPEQDIRLSLEHFPSLDLEHKLAEDVKTFVTISIADGLLNRYNAATKKLIFDRLLSSKERRFRWAELQIKELEKCHSDEDIKDTIAKIPPTLEASYQRILDGISARDTLLARDILIILCLSPVVLDLETVARMVKLRYSQDVVKICTTSLVSEFDDQIRVAHFSVQEFLTVDRPHHLCQFSAAFGHQHLAEMSLDWVLAYTQPLVKEEALQQPLLVYGAKYWYTHVDASGGIDRLDPEFKAKVLRLFTDSNVYFNWVGIVDREGIVGSDNWLPYFSWSVSLQKYDPPIYRAASMGLPQVVDELLQQGTDPNIKAVGRSHGNALHAASYIGHDKIVQMLLDRDTNVNAGGGDYGSALQAASSEGYERIVQMLLDRGADVNAGGGLYGSALLAASTRGHNKIVQMLLDRDADVNTWGGHYGSALQAASYRGHEKIVQMLLDRDANVNAGGGDYGSALQAASSEGYERIVQMLLDRGADVNARGGLYGSALLAASSEGYDKIVQMLLDRDADVNAKGGHYGSALQAASYGGHENIVKILLDRGADVNARGGDYDSALQAASSEGHDKIVQMLLNRDADVNAGGVLYGSALLAASTRGHNKIVQMLLDRDADVNAEGGHYGSALRAASYRGYEKIVQMLLDRDADVNAEGGQYGSALQAASSEGHDKIVQMLLDRGADVNARGGDYGSALQAASYRGHEKIVQMLLDRDANVNAKGGLFYSSALLAASSEGYDKIVQMLLDRGADVNAGGRDYGSALQAASSEGHDKIVKMLLDRGADVNAGGGDYGSALQAASSEGHDKIVQMLLDEGAGFL